MLARIALAIVIFILAFLGGFYLSFLFGANIHDVWPGVSGLAAGLTGAGWVLFRKR